MKKTFNKRAKQKKQDIYERVTETILTQLEKGTAPWRSPTIAQVGFPQNVLTKNRYQGINVFLLSSVGYASPWFLTYRQASELGGQVRKGERGHLIVKYGTYEIEGQASSGDQSTPAKRGYLRGYTVFNSSQVDGIDFPEIKHPEYQSSEQVVLARKIIEGMPNPPKLEEGPHACPHYQPQVDLVGMPSRETFESEVRFYSTVFHEFLHASGHESRLARKTLLENKGIMAGGSARQTYAKEELVAEMGACLLSAHAGIVTDNHSTSAAYLSSWLNVLKVKDNKRWVVEAASQAQKGANYILG